MRGLEPIYRTPTRWVLQLFFLVFYRIKVKGLNLIPRKGAALLVSNHQTFFDPPMLAMKSKRPIRFIARNSLLTVPILGFILRIFYCLPIDRDKPDAAAFKLIVQRLNEGEIVTIFPEGTRTPDGNVADLRAGFVRLAARSGCPLLPAVIVGAYDVWPRRNKYPFFKGKIILKYYRPIPFPADFKKLDKAQARKVECRICDEISRIFKIRVAAWQRLKRIKGWNYSA